MAIFGREPVLSGNSKSYIKLGWVRRIRDVEPLDTEESIRRYVRCQIFCMLGSTLFTDKSTAYTHTKYLPLLRDFERIHTYSWGQHVSHIFTEHYVVHHDMIRRRWMALLISSNANTQCLSPMASHHLAYASPCSWSLL
ncbi:hypothetical protein HN873_072494 [Arachis hypogaea]